MVTKAELRRQLETGEGCLGKSGEDEPLFLLCGRDTLAANKVRDWANDAEMNCEPTEQLAAKVREARQCADAMEAWPTRKLPD